MHFVSTGVDRGYQLPLGRIFSHIDRLSFVLWVFEDYLSFDVPKVRLGGISLVGIWDATWVAKYALNIIK